MVGSVYERNSHIDKGITGHNAFLHRLDDSLLHGGTVLLWNDPPDDFIEELESAAFRQGFDIEPAVTELAAASGLFLVASLDVGFTLDGFLVGNSGGFEVHFHAEFPFHLLHVDFDMDLAHAGNDHFLRLFVAVKRQRRILLDQAVDGDVIGDLNSRRGKVLGMDSKGANQIVKGQVPLAEILKYAPDLTSMTSGRGTFTYSHSHYEEVPAHLAEKIIAESKKDKEEA